MSPNNTISTKKGLSDFSRIFSWCAGTHLESLEKCPTEHTKYTQVGIIVFITGVMASLSGGYFFYSVFESLEAAIGFGIFWGLVIFFLDRYIVSSIHKPKNNSSLIQVILMAAPRIALAVVLAFVVSKPLELKFFETEIEFEMQESVGDYYDLVNNEKIKSTDDQISDWENKIVGWKQELSDKKAYSDQKQREYEQERFGTKTETTTGKNGYGPEARRKEQIWKDSKTDLSEAEGTNNQLIADARAKILSLKGEQSGERNNLVSARKNRDGPLAKLEALHRLTAKSSILWWANTFITLVFLLFESAPVLVKILSPRGSYETVFQQFKENEELGMNIWQSAKNHQLTKDHDNLIKEIEREGELVADALDKFYDEKGQTLDIDYEEYIKEFKQRAKQYATP
ncbi:MAG: DUF4407 domain-containing protein [Cyclobacteriaceae bacterium]